MIELIPAIDLLDGQCVRLARGDFNRVQNYELPSAQLAAEYFAAGAKWLHVVDLAASRDGESADTSALFSLLKKVQQRVQTGGGVRNAKDIALRLDAGASRVVVGSIAAESPERFRNWLTEFGNDALVAALDIQHDDSGNPIVRTHGWKQSSGLSLWELLDDYSASSLKHLLCTDINRDGLLEGPNSQLYREICERYPGLQVQASGGIRDISDLVNVSRTGVSAAISGKAILDGLYSITDAIRALEHNG